MDIVVLMILGVLKVGIIFVEIDVIVLLIKDDSVNTIVGSKEVLVISIAAVVLSIAVFFLYYLVQLLLWV